MGEAGCHAHPHGKNKDIDMNKRMYRNFDLDVDESVVFELPDGSKKTVTLIEVSEPRCNVRGVIRKPMVTIEVDGEQKRIVSGHYHMPVLVGGVRLDCPVTKELADSRSGGKEDVFALDKSALVRCWAPKSCLYGRCPMVYPVKQVWFATMTQMCNERTYIDADELPGNPPGQAIYHHNGLDFGGFDRAVPILAAGAAKIVSLGEEVAPGMTWPLADPRGDVIHALGEDGRYFRYSHIDAFAPDLKTGDEVEAGRFLGFMGQEGHSGGYSHLHFGMFEQMPSGRIGSVDAYCFAVEAYLNENPGSLLACARPHQVAAVDEPVELDGSNSICEGGKIVEYEWTLQNGREVKGQKATVTYDKEGMYSEIFTVTDDRGRTDVDFCVVQILPQDLDPAKTPPTMSVNYYPTQNLMPGQEIAFEARTFFRGEFKQNTGGYEYWDFGDGSVATTCSNDNYPEHRHDGYAQRWHAYEKPGRYIVTVTRTAGNGLTATARMKVEIDDNGWKHGDATQVLGVKGAEHLIRKTG